jgi:hypothetical protein
MEYGFMDRKALREYQKEQLAKDSKEGTVRIERKENVINSLYRNYLQETITENSQPNMISVF